MKKWRIVLADDHRMLRSGIHKILTEREDFEIVGEASDGLELLQILKMANPDMVIMDISMPNLRGIEATSEIKMVRPNLKVLILTMHKDIDYLQSAIEAGADGYLLKEDADEALFTAIDNIMAGYNYVSSSMSGNLSTSLVQLMRGEKLSPETKLTPRERSVLKLIAEGKTNKMIGDLLSISARTAETHRANIMKKLEVKTLAELIKYAISKGYLAE